MRVLVLGGTRYLGRHLVEALLAHGHAVTLFHRGLSNPGLFPEAEHLRGDRAVSLQALAGGRWDVVFDPSGFEPRIVRASARAVAATAAHYVFVSTISVYADPTRVDPDTPVAALDGTEDSLPLTLPDYGRLKVACERAVEEVLPGRVLHVRPGLIVGPHDVDERFRWWLQRVARGGEVLAPGRPDRQIQLIDVRDLAAWMMRCGERRLTGTYDATGPVPPLSMRELLETIRAVVGGEARFTWVPDEILAAHQAKAGSELPFWVPAASENILRRDVSRAIEQGLAFRPLSETVRDTWTWLAADWEREAPVRKQRALRVEAGMTEAREREILADAHRARAAGRE